jgi:hypothetical protein
LLLSLITAISLNLSDDQPGLKAHHHLESGAKRVELPTNPFAVLTFISAPAVLTNASCVLLFGTGNRYGRAIDRVHELAESTANPAIDAAELHLRARQLEAGETRAALIVRALTCFYTAVAGFVASTLISLVGAMLIAVAAVPGIGIVLGLAFVAGSVGVFAMILGSAMLARETIYSFRVLKEERSFLSSRVQQRLKSSS